jgi:hypothetical protein
VRGLDFPRVEMEPAVKFLLQYLLPGLITLFLWATVRPTPGLRDASVSPFSLMFVVKPMGWWDLGLLCTCAGKYSFGYTMPTALQAALPSYRTFLFSRLLWPKERILLAASMDAYHSVMAMWYTVCWSFTTLYLTVS